ncbi:putative short-chain reductase [Candidatus Fokinia solitaria]|uniref:Putative short-chain reductase n=1 Tax=Candidatus Fokinia solitaria TaxID=1802984 RepID=A0A2U8BSH9_9RICK|nr:SDR family NAD(P)-dependent oxidoreductase [Candidatus Fokinia solitaria]AWD33314.1 putative short-chain reductase [Candidatus Fokinia solitaria]
MRHVCITGSTSKLGTSIADFFVKNAWNVTMHYHSSPKNLDTYLSNSNTRLIRGDLRKHKDINMLSELIHKSDINLLINNVSILYSAEKKKIDKKFVDVLNVNYVAACALTKAIYEHSIQHNNMRTFHVINILDSELCFTSDTLTEYYVTKHALYRYTLEAALCFAPHVRVNGVALGPTIRNENQSEEHFKKISEAAPLNYSNEVSEVLAALNFLINSGSITGEIIHLGGGRHLSNKVMSFF